MRAPGTITYGEQLGTVEAGGFIFTETRHAPGLVLPRHEHENANFNVTVRGGCDETMGSRTEACAAASLAVKPPGATHANRYGPSGARCVIVEVTPARLAALGPPARVFASPSYARDDRLATLGARMQAELRAGDGAAALVLEGLALELVGHLARRRAETSPSAPPRWLREARDRLHETFAERVGLSALAAAAGVDPSYFARAFRRWLGSSVGDYVRRLRLEHAARQLAESATPVTEIAAACGFCDQSHLTNAFRRHLGVTPAEYRAASARGPSGPRRSRRCKTPGDAGGNLPA